MQFQPKFCIFYVKFTAKFVKYLIVRVKVRKKFDTKVEKTGSLGVDWGKKRGIIGCKIGVKKGGLLTGTWYTPTYGSLLPVPTNFTLPKSLLIIKWTIHFCWPCCSRSQVTNWDIQIGGFFMFSKQFLLYHKEGVKCWPGWYSSV